MFYSALWGSVLVSPSIRLPASLFVVSHINRELSGKQQKYMLGTDAKLMVGYTTNYVMVLYVYVNNMGKIAGLIMCVKTISLDVAFFILAFLWLGIAQKVVVGLNKICKGGR